MRRDKRGQAAMEFLMTYGWAILAAIVVIGILGYYYFDSDMMSPDQGLLEQPFYLNSWTIEEENVQLEIENNGGEDLEIYAINVSDCNESAFSRQLDSGGSDVFEVGDCGLNSGDSFDGKISITYSKQDSALNQSASGQLTGTVA